MRAVLALAVALAVALPAQAHAVPDIGFHCTPAPAGCQGWYRQPVTVHWVVRTGTIVRGCVAETVDFDTARTVVECEVDDGVAVTVRVPLKVDLTPPLVTAATPSRPPDANGWYRSPLQVAFSGSDALSGLAGCTAPGYGGPDGAATVTGTCTDNAGNQSAPTAFGLRYDSTPPGLDGVTASAGDRVVRLRLKSDAASLEVRRGDRKLKVADGRVVDDDVRNGRRYDYRVRAVDQAGNVAERVLTVVPGPHLLEPGPGAGVTEPPLLRWTTTRDADYYNVQLFRGRRKVLSAWPERPRLQLRRRWTFEGARLRLRPGRYSWLVWPGIGPRARSEYGRLIGRRTFTVAP